MSKERLFATEADLVRAYCDTIDPARWKTNPDRAPKWIQYHETAGWDLLLVDAAGTQIGIEAKLSLNAKVLDQALPGKWSARAGPDYRAVLVPYDGLQGYLHSIALHLGITVITVSGHRSGYDETGPWRYQATPSLPDGSQYVEENWPNWCPEKRCALPEYVPDVTGGHPSPLQLSPWKIKAIKLLLLLERTGSVSRRDMKVIGLSPTRWTDHYNGFLTPGPNGYVRNGLTPDLKAQHPTNWAQIEADFDVWSKSHQAALRLT